MIPKWDHHDKGRVSWSQDVGQVEALAVKRAVDFICERAPGALIQVITDSRTGLAAIQGRNLNKSGRKVEGAIASEIHKKIGSSEGGLIIIWNKAYMKDSEERTLEETKTEFAGINQSLGQIDEANTEDSSKKGQDQIARILHKWRVGNWIADHYTRRITEPDNNVICHTLIVDENNRLIEPTLENIRRGFWQKKFAEKTIIQNIQKVKTKCNKEVFNSFSGLMSESHKRSTIENLERMHIRCEIEQNVGPRISRLLQMVWRRGERQPNHSTHNMMSSEWPN